ncbi:ssl1552 [Synechocystis sp. PCC 6803]|uniref:Ssl1552 protein n=1 Tax=Synechocystis sp. (strain ATCC 27184 / PCC 6803 / Kazusa) TaxID=1111708 RepID=P74776_SYNY3|nr:MULTISPECIES: hypothetical protein [unclassified Synechocystis]BAM53885.1 hypothetical protein BEST7613_4954 [Synechocystis sp. PCC 6803] [Bacillus subtilis BEST7613]AGF52811.1 hypothetical protein MYO_125820 [Synechocystis sp. PCC 6803]ALJ68719.1 hypothetical protein AOY38_13280 [Synechocystis sp. PCC 6803]AVP90574.1 hypothetical protein C7I86_13385 [Synechocystis sp. IPPAS B-1465]MBD2616673.1 hypothetical protein [Synechocystis sp. FACHB-898]
MVFPSPNGGGSDQGNSNFDEYDDITGARREEALKKARNWFVILVVGGLVLGVVVAFGVVQVLNSLGLTEKPDAPLRIEMERENPPQQ